MPQANNTLTEANMLTQSKVLSTGVMVFNNRPCAPKVRQEEGPEARSWDPEGCAPRLINIDIVY